jgi:hypothetical protein
MQLTKTVAALSDGARNTYAIIGVFHAVTDSIKMLFEYIDSV